MLLDGGQESGAVAVSDLPRVEVILRVQQLGGRKWRTGQYPPKPENTTHVSNKRLTVVEHHLIISNGI